MELPHPFQLDGDLILADLPGAQAVFSTRATGNLGLLTDDPTVPGRRADLERRLGVRFAWRKQVHGHRVDRVEAPSDPREPWVEADGVLTSAPGVAPLVLGADCLTVVLADGHAVAAVHAGWHGLDERILERAVERLREADPAGESDTVGPMTAAIGPAAGPCCYEVGPELHERFAAYGASRGTHLDLVDIARQQLSRAGVVTVHATGLCTMCAGSAGAASDGAFFSHRRDGAGTGRQAGIGWLTS